MSKSMVARMLRDRYYLGVVTYKGVEYPGNHEPLVDVATFESVSDVIELRSTQLTRMRTHDQYLRGTLVCGRCDRQLVFTRNRGRRGDEYDYYFCPGRRDGCTLPYLSVDDVEAEVVGFWQRCVSMPRSLADAVRADVARQVAEEHDEIDRRTRKHQRSIVTTTTAQDRLLDAYLAGTITKEQFSARQEKHNKQLASAQRALQANSIRWHDIERTFEEVLELAQNAGAAYARATPTVRAQLNRAFFTRIRVDADEICGAEVTDTFAVLLTEDVVRRASDDQDHSTPAADPWEGTGVRVSNWFRLVPPTGFEPVPPP